MSFDLRFILSLFIASLSLAACGGGGGGGSSTPGGQTPSPDPDPTPTVSCTTPADTGGVFSQTTRALGLCYPTTESPSATDFQVQGGGLAMSDIDKDGFLDLYVTHGIHEKGRLFLGTGSGFEAAANNNGIQPRGLDNAGYFFDIDSDGWDDFISIQYTTNYVEIFKNDRAGQFTEATSSTGIFLRKPTYSVAAADYDLDGDVDLFFAHWGAPWDEDAELTEYLWQNNGDGFFTDVSPIVPIKPTFREPPYDDLLGEHSFTPTFADINSDGYPDLLLTVDYEGSQVLINNAGASFTDATTSVISDENGMGSAVADYDNDGDLDWFVTSIYFSGRPEDKQYQGGVSGNRLYENDGNGNFSDVTDAARVRDGDWGWGTCFADFDNDGYEDIFHTNGMRSASSQENNESDPLYVFFRDPSKLFMSTASGAFGEVASTTGINHDDQGRGAICLDYDSDGWVDILVSTNGKSPTVFRNRFNNSNHYLQIDLDGAPGNLSGIGARVVVETSTGTQMQEVIYGSSYLSQKPSTLHFGLGAVSTVDAVTVTWPDASRTQTRIENIEADQRITISHP
jgi:hypothetical protein